MKTAVLNEEQDSIAVQESCKSRNERGMYQSGSTTKGSALGAKMPPLTM